MRRVTAVERAIAMVDVVTSSDRPLKIAALAAAVGVPRNTAYELVATLVDGDVLSLSEGGLVSAGPRLLQWGGAYARTVDLVSAGRAVAQAVAHETDTTVHIARLEGRDVIYLVKEEGSLQIRMGSAVGRRVPAHATGVGKAILGSLPADELEQFLDGNDLAPMTPATLTTADDLRADLATVARDSVAFDREESSPDVCCIASAVRDESGRVVAGLSVSTLASRMTPGTIERLSAAAIAGAAQLSARLGYHPGSSGQRATDVSSASEIDRA